MREIRSAAVKLRTLRAYKNMSILELSDRSGVSPRTINRMEAADMVGYNPQVKTLASLSRVFGIKVGLLLATPISEIVSLAR